MPYSATLSFSVLLSVTADYDAYASNDDVSDDDVSDDDVSDDDATDDAVLQALLNRE